MKRIMIYRKSQLIAIVECDTVKAAWKAAIQYVRGAAHADGIVTPCNWYRTANRNGFESGDFRATDELAQRR